MPGGLPFLLYLVSVWAAVTGFVELFAGLRARGRTPAARDWIAVGGFTALLAIVFLLLPPDAVTAVGPARRVLRDPRRLPRHRRVLVEVGRGAGRRGIRIGAALVTQSPGEYKPSRRDVLRPVEYVGGAAIAAVFTGVVTLVVTRDLTLALIATGGVFIIVLVVARAALDGGEARCLRVGRARTSTTRRAPTAPTMRRAPAATTASTATTAHAPEGPAAPPRGH